MNTVVNPERAKYQKLWGGVPAYREVSPGEGWAQQFLMQARPPQDADVIDFGCGTGRGGLALGLYGAMRVTLLDFTDNCLDPFVADTCVSQPARIKFAQQDLTQPIPHSAAYGYCCDVMEHVPTEDVDTVLRNILASAQHVFFAISTVDDVMGAAIGEPLHLTVQPMAWWIERLTALGAVVHWSREVEGACAIYCSSWAEAADAIKGRVNVDDDTLNAQVLENVRAGWMHIVPHDRQDREVVLLAGGPSTRDHLDEIIRLRAEGCFLITVNGAYQWAIDAGLKVSAQIVLDAREFNARFTKPVMKDCRYLIASQVHPKALEDLPRERTYLWHTGGVTDEAEAEIVKRVGAFFPTPGGSTVVLRAIPLLRMMGFWRMHIFGFDSCVTNGDHHSYPQPENDREPVIPVTCGGRTFECAPWMVSQASEFRDLVKFMGDEIELAIYGDGLIAQIVKTGASFSEKE
jgi:SAM-dependent methyltransferase